MAVTWKQIAFVDDVATLSDTSPSDIGTSAAAGNGTAAARYNHVHALGSGTVDGSTIELNAGALRIKDGGVTSAKLASWSANRNCAGYQAVDLVIYQKSTAPDTPVVGKIYQDSDDQKLYICTSAT